MIRDTRSKIGKTIKHPITGNEFKVIADPVLVDPKFGTGAVKVTPAHDPNDFECGLRHDLPMISIFDEKGVVTAAGGPFAGLDRFKARKAVKARLAELGLERGRSRTCTRSVIASVARPWSSRCCRPSGS